MYATGEAVANDPIEAHKWFAIAAQGGDPAAKANLGRSESQLTLAQIAEGQRRAAQWIATRSS
jgi:TPR repeat protein